MNDSQPASGNSALTEIVGRIRGREVWVVGDLMLDEYIHGDVSRISPEAPVQVVRVGGVQNRLGGAANVARQVAVLGANVALGGVIGEDEAGEKVLAECAAIGVNTRGVLRDSARNTTRKLRVLGHGQQLLRLDWDDPQPCSLPAISDLVERLESGATPDVIILSDYAKGVLTDELLSRLMAASHKAGCRVLIDPKRKDFDAYRGASLLTPNLGELSVAMGRRLDPDDHASIAAAAREFLRSAELECMVVTLSERGMLLVHPEGEPLHVPAVRRAVSDVTGAGDTAIAVMATSLAAGASLQQAVEVANVAAGLAVAEVGAVAIEPDQILLALEGHRGRKLLSLQEIEARAGSWRAAGKRIAFTNGCFDLLHAGHLSLLHSAADLGDVLVLAINSDESVRRLKGPDRPIVSENERAALLSALSCVDAVTIFDEDTPLEVLRAVRPHVLVKGQDYRVDQVVGREIVEADGGQVTLVPLLGEKSTTGIVERIQRGSSDA